MHKFSNSEYELHYSINDSVHIQNLIFLHEGLGSRKSWGRFPSQLTKALPISYASYDRALHGKSTQKLPDTSNYFDFQVEELRAFIRQLNIKNPILVGHSDGATTALLYAAKYPDAVKSVISMAAHIYSEEKTDLGVKATLQKYLHEGLKEILYKQHKENTDKVFYKWYNYWSKARDNNLDLGPYLKKVKVPVLALQGDKDEYATDNHLWDIKSSLKYCKAHIIQNCGHFPHISQEKEVIKLMTEFIR